MALLPFVAAYTKASGSQQVKATGLTVTVSVFRVTRSDGTILRVVNAASATALTDTGTTGAYFYHYSATLDFTLYWYFASFTTADATVQQVDIASAWFDFPESIAKTALGKVTADVDTIKTQTVTCGAAVTIGAFVGQATAAIGVNASGHVSRVTLADTITTYTGDTPQTGDSFARLGAPAGASVSADIAAIQAKTTNLPTDPADQSLIIAATTAIYDRIGPAGAGLTAITAVVSGTVDANIVEINDVTIGGTGTTGDPWGPA